MNGVKFVMCIGHLSCDKWLGWSKGCSQTLSMTIMILKNILFLFLVSSHVVQQTKLTNGIPTTFERFVIFNIYP